MLFGGRRATTVPLVYESRDWNHGVFVGATMGSEKTAAAFGGIGELRHDPFAMLPFCGYHMGDYFGALAVDDGPHRRGDAAHASTASTGSARTTTASFLWPGYGENSRVLEWICRRLDGDAGGVDTAIGVIPSAGDLELEGLDVSVDDVNAALAFDAAEWRRSVPGMRAYFAEFGDRLPPALAAELDALEERLS